MSNSQIHGKKFEDILKCEFSGASDNERANTSKWDIEARFDKSKNISTSIKASGSLIVGMSDARNFFKIEEDFRLLVGIYTQRGFCKNFEEIREYFITKDIFNSIRGDLTLRDIELFHNAIKTKPGKEGQKVARQISNDFKLKFIDKKTKLILNPKIDSKSQRRLQCSLNLKTIESIDNIEFYVYTESFRDLMLPISIKSSKREFNK